MIYIVIFNLNVLFLLKYVVDYLCLFREERVFTDPGSALSYLLSVYYSFLPTRVSVSIGRIDFTLSCIPAGIHLKCLSGETGNNSTEAGPL